MNMVVVLDKRARVPAARRTRVARPPMQSDECKVVLRGAFREFLAQTHALRNSTKYPVVDELHIASVMARAIKAECGADATLIDIATISPARFRKYPGLGEKSLNTLIEILASYRLQLGMRRDEATALFHFVMLWREEKN